MTPQSNPYLHLLLSAMLFSGSVTAAARPITEDKACVMATKFYYMKVMGDKISKVTSLKALDLVYSSLHAETERYTAPEYYIFAPSNGKIGSLSPDTTKIGRGAIKHPKSPILKYVLIFGT